MHARTRSLLVELGFVAAAFVYYVGGNVLLEASHEDALGNSRDLVWLQGVVGLNVEAGFQDFVASVPGAMDLLVLFYAGPHFVLTIGFLAWVWWRRWESFPYVRNAFLLFTLTAFAFQWIFPVAPPRMMPELGFTDSVTDTLPLNSETPWIKAMVNDVAALPSVHTGWAVLVTFFTIRLTHHRFRWLWTLYPATIMVSIVATANHFVWDILLALVWIVTTEVAHAYLGVRHGFPLLRPQPAARPSPAT